MKAPHQRYHLVYRVVLTIAFVNKVLVWWHDQGKSPEYEPQTIETVMMLEQAYYAILLNLVQQVENGKFRFVGAYDRRVKMHLQDFVENTVRGCFV